MDEKFYFHSELLMANPYQKIPNCILKRLINLDHDAESYCAGFEFSEWRCDGLANNLIEWIVDYALKSDELDKTNHTNCANQLKQAAYKVYTTEKYERRGEIGEIVAHAICRTYFDTIPVAARVNYLSASNDPIKAFDLVHVRYPDEGEIELWLGEAKFYKDRSSAIQAAIESVKSHIESGFLNNQKLLLGPQVSSDIPHSDKIKKLLSAEESLDELINNAVFPVLIAANSGATKKHTSTNDKYTEDIKNELQVLWKKLITSGLAKEVKLMLIYVPLADKDQLSTAFDTRLKALQY